MDVDKIVNQVAFALEDNMVKSGDQCILGYFIDEEDYSKIFEIMNFNLKSKFFIKGESVQSEDGKKEVNVRITIEDL